MKLQKKSLLVFIALFISVLVVISIFFSTVILASYSALEEQYITKDLSQAVNKLDDELFSMSAISSDWGPWDDTVDFVNGNDPKYLKSNLQPYGFDNLHMNLIVFANSKGEIVYSGAYDLDYKVMVPVPVFFSGPLSPENPLMNMSDPHQVTSGIIMLPEDPMLVVSHPIVHSDFSGQPHGVVIMGRYLNKAEISRLSELTQPSLTLTRIDDMRLSPDLVLQIRKKRDGAPGIIRQLDGNQVAGYALIRDIFGNDALVLRITEPRSIYQRGVNTTVEVLFIILAGGLFLGLLVIILLDHVVLKRLGSLALQVKSIGKIGNAKNQVKIEGDDELSGLAMEINRMLDTIEKFHEDLSASEARFREMSDLLPQIIFEIDTNFNLTYVNKFGMEMFGLTENDLKVGLNARQLMMPDDVEQMTRNLKKVTAGEKSPGNVYTLIRKDKSLMRTLLFSSPIIHDGRLEGFRGSGIDISDRFRLEEALKESEDYLQTLIKSIHVGIFVIDATTHVIVDANPVALKMIGTTKDAVINKQCHKVICPAEVGRCPITDLHKRVDNAERTLLTRDGREISIIKYVVPLMLHGKPCLLETFIDNTYRKQIELKLAESEEKYRTLTENTGDILFSADIRGFVTYVSPQIDKYGYILPDIIGQPLLNFIHPDDRSKVMNNLSREFSEGAPLTSTFRILDKLGNTHWFEENSSLRKDAIGNPLGIYGVLRDITERKKVEEALVESEEKYRALTENTPDILFSADLYGIVTFVSPQVNRFGYLADEIVGQPLFNNIHPEDRGNVADKFKSDLHDGAQFISTFRFQDKWGNSHWFEEKSSLLLDQFGKPVGINGILRDVTEQKRAEDAIELANKKLNLMNNITRHDILNTITGLIGCVDMANATNSPEERNHLLNDIKVLTRVIERQISFTKQYQEVGVHLPLWQNVTEVIRRVLVNFEKSGFLFVIELENTEIYADPLLEKVFYNLVDNAIRYGEKATTIKFYFLISDQGLLLVCEDDGVGVPENFKSYIFERGMGKNTGMGLFLSREILSITKIGIRENGIPGKGARFEMLVPRGTFRFTR